ncbi:hypothetical protein, partial [Streptomyces sp. NRRL S-31]|uniref:hypothetical protein n=1 Tax=Streptomyces sp. NRRL S-31 TaxID=1463898 RepID=UPI00056589A8
LLRGRWQDELDDILPDDLEFAWDHASPSAGEQPGTSSGAGQDDPTLSGPPVVGSAEAERLLREAGWGRGKNSRT